MSIRLKKGGHNIRLRAVSYFHLRHGISPPFLPFICIILPFRSAREALRKEGRPLAV